MNFKEDLSNFEVKNNQVFELLRIFDFFYVKRVLDLILKWGEVFFMLLRNVLDISWMFYYII